MDEKTLILIFIAAIGLWATLVVVRWGFSWLQLMRMRFWVGDVSPVDRAAMPADVAVILDAMTGRLAALGFVYQETFLAQPFLRGGEAEPVWIDVHVHAESGSLASVQVADMPEPGLAAAVSFSTDYEHSMLLTENRRAHLQFPMPAHCRIEDAGAATLAEHWAFHRRRLDTAGEGAVVVDPETLRQRHRALRTRVFEHGQRLGWIRPEGDDWRLTARGAWRFLRQVQAGNKRLAGLPPNAEVEDVSLRVFADAHVWRRQEAMLKHNAMSRRGKVLWFSLSALAGAAAFGAMVSWEMVPAILGVLLFHEFGHALAMRAVGYRSLSVLVLPFLGAVAIGRKDDAAPWQKLAVLIAGPLPGLILAVICLRLSVSDPDRYAMLMTVGALALSINLFNLLPFTPLDGGQIVDTFLFFRRPRFRFAFFVLSTGALFGLAIALSSIPLAAAALLIALATPGAWRRMRLLSGMQAGGAGDDQVHRLLDRLHATQGPRWPAFSQRIQTLRMVLPWVSGRAPTWGESLAGMTVYLGAIVLPVALLWDTGLPQQAFHNVSRAAVSEAPPDWSRELAKATTPEARWKVLWAAGQWFENAEQEAEALRYYQQALAETARLPDTPQKNLDTLDARLAIARFADYPARRAVYVELLPVLRELPPAERWRLADVLEALIWVDSDATPETRIERYREAVAVREAVNVDEMFGLLEDRAQLARLIDAKGDSAAAEGLLRKNLDFLNSEPGKAMSWQIEPVAWFLIAHGRAAEAETLLAARPMPSYNSERLLSTLAWAHLMQGKTDAARQRLAEALEKMDRQRWNDRQRLTVLLDLIHASAGAPAEEARWLKAATELKAGLGSEYRGSRFLKPRAADRDVWEAVRDQARFNAYMRLPGAEDEARDDAKYVCK